jgi:lipoate-protein ligase A
MLVLSLTLSVRRRFANLHYTGLIHELISRGFRAAGLPEPRMRGISDLTFRERKVLGASLYRRRQRLLYQGVILVNAPVDTIAALLRHPDREPEYRRGRAHEEFLLNIRDLRPDATPRALAPALQRTLDAELPAVFAGELC